MASSTNQRHADELRQACEAFKAERLSMSSVEQLVTEVERVADRLAADIRAGGVVTRHCRICRRLADRRHDARRKEQQS